jgi:hypothetical protein
VGLAPLNEFGIHISAANSGGREIFPLAQHTPAPAAEVQDGSAFIDRSPPGGKQLANGLSGELAAM